MLHDYQINPQLTGISLAYKNPEYIADKIFPKVSVDSELFKYRKWDKGTGITLQKTLIGATGSPNEVEMKSRLVEASVEAHGLKARIPQATIEAAEKTGKDILGQKTAFLTEAILATREARVASMLSTASLYNGNSKTLTTNEKFNAEDSKASSLIYNVISGMKVVPNTMILSKSAAYALRQNPEIVKAYNKNSGDGGIATTAFLKEHFELTNLYIGTALVNAAKEGKNVNIVPAWGNDIILAYINPVINDAETTFSFGITAEYEGRTTSQYFDPDPGVKGVTTIKTTEQLKELILCPECGYLLKGVC